MGLESVKYENPNETDLKLGTQWFLKLDGSNKYDPGEIFAADSGIARWRHKTQPQRDVFVEIIFKPDFVLVDAEEKECLRIRRRTLGTFEMIEGGQVVGLISLRNLLRNKYTLELRSGLAWTIHMRLFTIYFPAECSSGKRAWIMVGPSKQSWNVLIQQETDSVHLLCFLAFVHREWWKFG